jgi:hypothetical protein
MVDVFKNPYMLIPELHLPWRPMIFGTWIEKCNILGNMYNYQVHYY